MEGKEVYGGTMSKQSVWNMTIDKIILCWYSVCSAKLLFLILPALVGWFFILLIIALGLDPTR
jgi:hypothetical protein